MPPSPIIFRAILPLLCLLATGREPILALDPAKAVSEYSIQVWGAERGFEPFAINAIIQSRDGFLWLGTDEGLVRFDGTQFMVYNRANTPELAIDNITSIAEDDSGTLWLGTRGAGLFAFRNRVFDRFTTKNGLPGDSVNCVLVDQDNRVWIGLDQGDVCVMENGSPRVVPPRSGPQGLGVLALARRGAELYVAKGHTMLTRRDGTGSEETHHLNPAVLRTLLVDRSKRLWIGTSLGVYAADEKGISRLSAPGLEKSVAVPALLDDRAGNLWIGTEGSGLYRYSGGTASRLSLEEGLPSDRVLSLCEDAEGNLWVGTRGGGLIRIRDNSISMTTIADGLADDFVTSVMENDAGTLWVGTRGAGVHEIKNGRVVQTYSAADGLPDNLVRALVEDREGNLWVGTSDGLSCLRKSPDRARRKIVRYTPADGVPDYSVRALMVDRTGVLWIGTYGGGVLRLENGRFRDVDPEGRFFPAPYIRAIVEDSVGAVWVGSQGGLARYAGGKWESFTAGGALAPNIVFTLYTDSDGSLWIGTYNRGIYRYRNGQFRAIRKSDGLFDDVVYTILDDGLGFFWMSSNKGIFRVHKEDLNGFADGGKRSVVSQSYGVADGMNSAECNGATQPSGWRARDGRLFFPTVKGLASLRPGRMRANPAAPLVCIDLAIADNDTLDITPGARLRPGTRRLEIRYTGLNFFAPEKIRFRYRLEGFDEAWIEADTRRQVFYTNIPHGEYLFRVKACNSDGVWTEQGASLAVVLPPRLWESWWFRIGTGAAALASIVSVVRRREKRIKSDELRRHEIRAQMLELESRALRARMNPHFIFNALNAVQESVLSGNTEAACQYLSKFARLLRMILDHSGRATVPLDLELELLKLYVEIESLRLDRDFEYRFDVDPELARVPHPVPPMILQPFVENALWHGLAGKDGARKLIVSVTQSGDALLFAVEDNGVGRGRAAANKEGRPHPYESRGVALTQDRLTAMNAARGVKATLATPATLATLEMIDLFDPQGAPAGTRVELRLPLEA